MCGGVYYGKFDRLVSVERWSCSRGASELHANLQCMHTLSGQLADFTDTLIEIGGGADGCPSEVHDLHECPLTPDLLVRISLWGVQPYTLG